MSQANELTSQIISYVYKTQGFAYRSSSTGIFDKKLGTFRTAPKKGVSDVVALAPLTSPFPGRFIAIEVKIGKDSLSPEQAGFLLNVEHYGGISYIARDFDSFKEWWDEDVCAE